MKPHYLSGNTETNSAGQEVRGTVWLLLSVNFLFRAYPPQPGNDILLLISLKPGLEILKNATYIHNSPGSSCFVSILTVRNSN